jgi:hypothetical protein
MTCPDYRPGYFDELYNTDFGRRLWIGLNDAEAIQLIVAATEQGRPAVEGVDQLMFDEFKRAVSDKKVRQMAGHMVGQILERLGFEQYQSGVRTKQCLVFKSGSVYRPRTWDDLDTP